MPVIVDLPDGREVEFPDGMSQAEMADAIDANFGSDKPQYLSTDYAPKPPTAPVDIEAATTVANTLAQERSSKKNFMSAELARLQEADAGAFASKAFGVAESIARPLSNPLRATEELVEGVAVETGIAKPGSKLLLSPDREIGRAVNRMGELSSGLVEDVAVVMRSVGTGELEHGGNLLAAVQGQPRPVQEAIKDVGGYEEFAASISTTISHLAPQIILQRGLVKRGVPEAPAAGASFGFTEEGFDPKTALIMAAFPGVAAEGKAIALKALGASVTTDTARSVIGELGGYVAAQVYLDASTLPDYMLMTPAEAKKAWAHNFGVNLAFHLAHVPGMTKSAIDEIKASRAFNDAINESALESAAARSLPSNAQRTVAERVGPATTDAVRVPPLGARPTEEAGAAESEQRQPRRPQPENRPWDLIDEIESQLGGKMSLRAARELNENFKPFGALRRLFAQEGYAPDIAAQSTVGFKKFESGEQLLEALTAAAEARKTYRAGQSQEQQQIKVEEKQRVEFEDKVLQGERPGDEAVERVPVQDLFLGDRFKVMDRELEVSDLEFDADGRLLSLTVKDGPKFGVQTITPDMAEFIHVDKATFEPAKRSTDFVEPDPAAAAGPKLRPMEKQGDLLSTQQEAFNLAGEKGTDFDRVAQERAAAEQTAREAAEIQARQQQNFALDAATELDRPRPAFKLNDGRIVFSKQADSHVALERDAEARGIDLNEVAAGGWLDTAGKFYTGDLGQFTAKKSAETFESRIQSRRGIFDLDDAELGTFFERRFGARARGASPLSAGRAGQFSFPTFEAFRDWMDARYAERDIDGMRLAFAEAPTAQKVGYIKENRGSDPHKRDWIGNLATGAPLPKDSPPITRTTPRPMPGGGTSPVSPPPARPGQPPPPPREPSKHRKFDVMALTQLFRQFHQFPEVNERLERAYGRFIPGTKAIELKARLLWDTKLAERVLGHEIGHFIDLIITASGKGKEFASKLKPLFDFRGQLFQKEELRNEARSLSREWRGNFANGDRYRDSASELFADFMSAMFNNPQMVNAKYPKLYDAFQELRDSKPEFKTAYREIETWLQGDTMAAEWMGQQKAAVNRTLDELVKPRETAKASFMDRLKFATVSLWHRAFEKEGKPRELGDSITDELEYNQTWAAKENALFADDFAKQVQPELAKVSSDPIEARTALLSYSQAFRTVFERRASGRWIEDNPVESREMLERVLELDDSLRSQFGSQFSSARDAELYDLSAAIFREVHDRGEPFVNKMAKEIDALELGVDGEAALLAFNVRGKLLNPGGLTEANAHKVMETLEQDLGATRYRALETAAKNLRDLLHDVQSKMHDEGLIGDKIWKELILPNRGNYLPYAVLDHFEGRVRAGVMPQKGTAKDIADIVASTQLKVAASNVWRQQQRQVQLLRDVYEKGGMTIPLGEPMKRARDIDAIRARHLTDDTSRAVLWHDGKPHLVEFLGDAGKLLEKAMAQPSFYEQMGWIVEASDATHRVMQLYTQFSVPFLFWRNPVRGARTSSLKVGFGRVAQQMTPAEFENNALLAKNYADAAFGAKMLPEVRELIDRQVLLPPHLSQAMVRDAGTLRQMLANHTVLANQVRGLRDVPAWWKRGGEPGRKIGEGFEKLFSGYEAFEKIYSYHAALAKGLTAEQATAIGRRSGIPKPGVGGKWSFAMEVFLPWTRVHIQGARATFDMLRDPNLRAGFATRFLLTEALPRVAKYAIATGVVTGGVMWLMRDDEDKSDPVMPEVMRRVSPYKMALDDIVPLMLYDARKGDYHYFWDYTKGADIPKHFEVVSLRLPASEEGRLWGVLLYNLLISTPEGKEKAGRPGKGIVENVSEWAFNYMLPGVSPVIEWTGDAKEMLMGRNPNDSYRGQPAMNPKLFDAGGVDRAQAIAGYTLNQLGSVGELGGVLAANLGLLDERALNSLSQRIATDKRSWEEKVPFLKTAVSHDNYGQYREEKGAELAEDRIRAKARLLMSGETRALYDFYYKNLNRKNKLSESESEQFELARDFVQNIWGTLTTGGEPNPDSFYSKAAHAVSDDGSSQAKETVKRDLDNAAAGHIANFLELNQR